MVVPEVGKDLLQLTVAIDGAIKLAFGQIPGDYLLGTAEAFDAAA